MDDLDPTANKETVLTQIDRLHEEHRLKILRELAEQYNANSPNVDGINLNNCFTALDLIISLWMRGIKIPSGIAIDSRYDDTFANYVYSGTPYNKDVRSNRLTLLLQHPKELIFFIYTALDHSSKYSDRFSWWINEHKEKDTFVRIWLTISPTISQHTGDDFVRYMHEYLTPFDLAFLAISLEKSDLFYRYRNLGDFYFYIRRI